MKTNIDLIANDIWVKSIKKKFLDINILSEELLDEKKRAREKLGSVNLRADEETEKYENEIKKMEQDRQDLVTAIIKLKEGINE